MATLTTSQPLDASIREAVEPKWKRLFQVAGVAALLCIVFFPLHIVLFILNPLPESIAGWFALLQSKPLIGLVDLDILLITDEALTILIFLGLYIALRRLDESWITIAAVLGILSTLLFITSNPAIAMLSLSRDYAAATTDAQRAVFLAAGQAHMSGWQGSDYHVGYILGSISPIITSIIMLRSRLFSKATAYLGLLANLIGLGIYVPVVGTTIAIFSVAILWAWYILLARHFFRFGAAR